MKKQKIYLTKPGRKYRVVEYKRDTGALVLRNDFGMEFDTHITKAQKAGYTMEVK